MIIKNIKVKKSLNLNKYSIFLNKIFNKNKKKVCGKQKTRGEVNFSNIKPWKQKGTGRARAGSKSSPIWKGGGKAFPSSSKENIQKKINKNFYKKIFYLLFYYFSKKIFFLIEPNIKKIKTYIFKDYIEKIININGKKILIVKKYNFITNTELSSRNIKNINFINILFFSAYDILKYDIILILTDNFEFFKKRINDIKNKKIYN
ncbi:uL4 family ribosomal protein [Candidatus Vidania fulgoroideorum]